MQFLPNGYRFIVNNMQNSQHYLSKLHIILVLVILIMLILFISVLIGIHTPNTSACVRKVSLICLTTAMLSGLVIVGTIYQNNFSRTPWFVDEYYTEQRFKLADHSNLYITMHGKIPKTRLDKVQYPYEIHLSDDFNMDKLEKNDDDSWDLNDNRINDLYYIGSVNNGKLKLQQSTIAAIFYKYAQYINQHHLAAKFKKCAYLEYDSRYMSTNNKPQVVLTNHKDTVLHMNENATVEQTNVVQN